MVDERNEDGRVAVDEAAVTAEVLRLFLLLLFCEIAPLLVMLDYSYIQIFRFEEDDITNLADNGMVGLDNEQVMSSEINNNHQI